MSHGSFIPGSPAPGCRAIAVVAVGLLLATVVPVLAAGDSARYRFEGNKWLSLDLKVEDVRAEVIRFEWPATVLRMKTGYKATVRVGNGSSRQTRIGIGLILYGEDGKPIGAGTTGTRLGTIDPGDSAEFSVDFNHLTERLEQAAQFHLILEVR